MTFQLHEHSTTDIQPPPEEHGQSNRSLRFEWAKQAGGELAKFELALNVWTAGSGMAGRLAYSCDLFERATVERMAGHFSRLVAGAVTDPDVPVSRLEILSDSEREWELTTFNQTTRPVTSPNVPDLIDRQAAITPDAVAVGCGERQLTYRQLTQTANTLAHQLIDLGAGPDQLVAVRLPRSPELIIALLGILKAGAAYLPLDPDDPPARHEQILTDAQPITVLDDLPPLDPRPDPPPNTAGPQHLAYAIYTSGSTGTPKGTLIEHHSLTNYISWFGRSLRLAPAAFRSSLESASTPR